MKIYTTVGALLIGGLFLATSFADADKAVATLERTVVGQGIDYEIVPNLGEAARVGDIRIWSDSIHVKDAFFLKPHFAGVNLRAGDAIIVRSATGKVVETITGRGPKGMGTFWGLSGRGEELFLEFHFSNIYATAPFRIDKVLVGDMDPFSYGENTKTVCGSDDFEDVKCYEGDSEKWSTVTASVGVMTFASTPSVGLWCSGANVSPDNYILTAKHCIPTGSACNNAEFVFKYHNTSCGSGPPTSDWQSFRCDDIVASSPWDVCEVTPSTLDFSLTSVVGDPASTFGYIEVDHHPVVDGEALYIVQHALGRPQEITHGSGGDVDADSPNLRYYNTLDTDNGASGAPIIRESDNKLVGMNHCGGCDIYGTGNRGVMASDIYPLIRDYVCDDGLDVSGDGAQNLSEVSGNGDSVVHPGETWQFEPLVRNAACTDDALGVVGDVVLNAGSNTPVTITGGAASFGDVLAGQTNASLQPVVFDVDMGVECGEEIIFDLANLDANNGGPFPTTEGTLRAMVGELMYSSLILESFAGGIPGDWDVIHNGTATGPAATWTTENPGDVSLPLTEPFAIVDSDEAGSGNTHDEELITPPISGGGYDKIELRFNHDFHWWSNGGNEQGDVDIRSSATGGSWVNIANYSFGDRSGNVVIDISAFAVDQTNVQVRFHYYDASFDYWWAVDDVEIVGGIYMCGTTVSPPLFVDGFESGDTSAWDTTSP